MRIKSLMRFCTQASAVPAAPIHNKNAKYCEGCQYWGGGYVVSATCNYIFIEGHRRPCPPGKDCTKKVKGKSIRLQNFGEVL